MALRLNNTLTRKIQAFKPMEGKKVKLFVCGVTEYDYVHLGHARTYAFYDTLVRYLRHQGFDVTYLQNVTDVGHMTDDTGEDKVEKKALKEGKTPQQVVDFYLRHHLEAFDRLHLLRPDLMKKATDHIPEILEQTRKIMENGYAYEADGSVYFDVSKFKGYGKLSGRKTEELKAGARVRIKDEKEDPRDFALWIKAPKSHVQKWDSPWGVGYPGWHIEDTAIALKYFGPQYDVHGGAVELAFPHHEAEVAQAEATTGKKPYVKYWVHTGVLTIKKEKMAKSKGNFIRLADALERHEPEVLRMWIASTHYRKPLDYNEKDIENARKKVEKIASTLERIDSIAKEPNGGSQILTNKMFKLRDRFFAAMDDDMNTPLAISHLLEAVSQANRCLDSKSCSTIEMEAARKAIEEMGSFFQVVPKAGKKEKASGEAARLLQLREKARKEKKFGESDVLRDRLKDEFGILVEDTPKGQKWKRA